MIEVNWTQKKEKKNGEWGGVRSCHACGYGQGRWEEERTVRQFEIGDSEDETELIE